MRTSFGLLGGLGPVEEYLESGVETYPRRDDQIDRLNDAASGKDDLVDSQRSIPRSIS